MTDDDDEDEEVEVEKEAEIKNEVGYSISAIPDGGEDEEKEYRER